MTSRSDPQFGYLEEIAEPSYQSLKDLREYWLAKKADRIAPTRADIDPIEIHHHLGNLALVEVVGAPPRFRFRLYGTNLFAANGRDLTGKFVDEVYPGDIGREMIRQGRALVRECRISVARGWYINREDHRLLGYERIALPLCDSGRTVNMILCGFAIETRHHWSLCSTGILEPAMS